jgi:hypothetical protein
MPGHSFQRGNTRAGTLTGEQVIEIRERYATERGLTQGQLCHDYHVSISTIANIIHGRTWQHLLRGAEPTVCRPPVHARLGEIPDVDTLKERMLARLDQVKPERRAPSLYNEPSPTEAEDQALAMRGLERLNRELDGPKPLKQQQVSDELDKLEKGQGD